MLLGLPGDAKPQNAPKLSESESTNGSNIAAEEPRVDEVRGSEQTGCS